MNIFYIIGIACIGFGYVQDNFLNKKVTPKKEVVPVEEVTPSKEPVLPTQ